MTNNEIVALEQAIQDYTPMVLKLAMSILYDREEARDISQEVFLQLFKVPQVENKKAWLYKTAIHLAINRKKQNQARKLREQKHSRWEILPDNTNHVIEKQEQLQIIQKQIVNLPEKQRDIFLLRHRAQMPLKEIAESLGISLGTVKTQLHRALGTLRNNILGSEEANNEQ